MHLAVGFESLEARVVVDLVVDRDGHVLDLAAQSGIALTQRLDEIDNAPGLDLDALVSAGVVSEGTREDDDGHGQGWGEAPVLAFASLLASRAARTRGGARGRSVKRTPVADRTAFATVARGGTMGVSPTPRTP